MSAGKAGRGGGRRRAAEGRCLVAQQGGAAGRESRGSALCEGRWGSAPPLRTSEESPGPASGHLGTRGRDGALSGMPVVAGGGGMCACARRWATGEPPGLARGSLSRRPGGFQFQLRRLCDV